jgi:hypothetical protein
MARKVFYSFHYQPDSWRAATVRNIGILEGSSAVSDNDWETVKKGGDVAIKKWIATQMYGRSCTVVLVGNETANRKWINHEIIESWKQKMGVVGIRIHGLKNQDGGVASIGENPFDYLTLGAERKKLSTIVKCYDPSGSNSKERYDWIKENLEKVVEEAIKIRNAN